MPIPPIPAGDVPAATGWLGFTGFVAGMVATSRMNLDPSVGFAVIVALSAVPMWVFEYYRAKSHFPQPPSFGSFRARTAKKCRAFMGGTLIWSTVLLALQEFAPNNVSGFFTLVIDYWPVAVLTGLAYLLGPAQASEAGLVQLVDPTTRRGGKSLPWSAIRESAIKAFFLPQMFTFAYVWVAHSNWTDYSNSPLSLYLFLFAASYLLDTVFSCIGYTTTSIRLGAQIRSTDNTWAGWISALICYAPLAGWVSKLGLTNYRTDKEWDFWLGNTSAIALAWAAAILILTAVYAWATVAFGVRFSNLTRRGLVTNGPYKYSKHPAYICKNMSWWLISVPFLSIEGPYTAFLHCCSLAVVNLIYFIRAKTEERHMMLDPRYKEYAAWIAQYGVIARFKKLIKFSRNSKFLTRG